MIRSARRTKRRSTAWMCDWGCLSTQPWWRPYSVACTVTSHGTPASRASLRAAPATSQSWECTRSTSRRSTSSAPAARMSSFMWSTQEMNASRSSLGKSGSRTRWTITPCRSSSAARRPPPLVSTCTSVPWATSCSASLRTWRARPPSTIGGYSQERIRTRGGTGRGADHIVALSMPVPILLDCDPGHDDAVAILLAAGNDAIDLRAITTVAGNCPLDLATRNARRVAALAGLDVPIAAGADGPRAGELVTAPDIHGETGLDGHDLSDEAPLDERTALELMVATLEASDEPVTLVPTGPLTNVAALLEARPDLHARIREIVVMGGSTHRGNTTPAAEFNIWVDPESAAVVFSSGLPLTMIGLNLTHQAGADREVLERVQALPGAPARAVADWMVFFGSRYERVYGRFAPPVHDPCTVALLIDPEVMTLTDTFVAVETEGRWTRGMTVVDLHGRLGREPNARVALELDAPRFWDLVIGALERLA